MVQHSGWALPLGKQDEWDEEIVLQWFDPDNTDTSDCFLERAETFLHEGARGTSWGASILGKVIKTNSYVIFFRMGGLFLHSSCASTVTSKTEGIYTN